jgi:hypothetical protein
MEGKATMASYRMWVPNRQGRSLEHFFHPTITPSSIVHVAACEATDLGSPLLFGQRWGGFIGEASISVMNISPTRGRVDFYIFVAWGSPLHVNLDITVLEPPVDVYIGR